MMTHLPRKADTLGIVFLFLPHAPTRPLQNTLTNSKCLRQRQRDILASVPCRFYLSVLLQIYSTICQLQKKRIATALLFSFWDIIYLQTGGKHNAVICLAHFNALTRSSLTEIIRHGVISCYNI